MVQVVGRAGTARGSRSAVGVTRAGLALAYRQYSPTYGADEDSAKTAKLGMWSGAFTAPWAWRRSQ